MNELLQIGLLPLVLTLGAYEIGSFCRKKINSPAANPVLIAVIIVVIFMQLTGLTGADYQAGMTRFSWLLTPATVSLAVPMYEHLRTLRKNLPAMLAGISAGAVACLIMVLGFAWLFHFDRELLVSLLPKSVTSAIGVPLCEMAGGLASVATAVIIITGIVASILGTFCCRLFRLTDPVAQGVAFGTSGHVIGTVKANELSPITGAASSLALVVAGLLTAVIFPFLTDLI